MIKNIIDKNLKNLGLKYWRVDKMFPYERLILQMQANSGYTANVKACSQHVNRTELTCNKLTQLHDASRVRWSRAPASRLDWLPRK